MLSWIAEKIYEWFKVKTKGAKIDCYISAFERNQSSRDEFPPNPDRILRFHREEEIIRHWTVNIFGQLLIKNNSSITAYKLRSPNASSLFDRFDLPKVINLLANEEKMVYFSYSMTTEPNVVPDEANCPSISSDKERFPLKIEYENEGGTVFTTVFHFSKTHPQNVYIL